MNAEIHMQFSYSLACTGLETKSQETHTAKSYRHVTCQYGKYYLYAGHLNAFHQGHYETDNVVADETEERKNMELC